MAHQIGEFLRERGYQLRDCGDYWTTRAIFRGGVRPASLTVWKRDGRFKDWVVGTSGSPEYLAKIISGAAPNFITEQDYIPQKIVVPKIYSEKCLERLLPSYQMFSKRGISDQTMRFFKAGLAQKGQLLRRVCFPCRDEQGKIIGFAGRWFSEALPKEGLAKWKFVGRKTNFLFPGVLNREEIEKAGQVILVESIGDILSLWESGVKNAFCLFGTSLGKRHMSYVSCLDVEDIVIALNDDVKEDGTNPGQDGAAKALEKLNKVMDAGVTRIVKPSKNDFGAMSGDEIREWKKCVDETRK
jgi:hypothetical protein